MFPPRTGSATTAPCRSRTPGQAAGTTGGATIVVEAGGRGRQALRPWQRDDGYAPRALTTIAAIDVQGTARPRCVGIIETCEESGSPDLLEYLQLLAARFGDVQLVVGLDSGCRNYEQLWVTTSLRGLVGGTLTVEILSEGVHSGHASGIVPSSFRIARQLLNRLDDAATGVVLLPELHTDIPEERTRQANAAGAILGDSVWTEFPWVSCNHGAGGHAHSMPTTTDPVEAIVIAPGVQRSR
jgi:acetylornithine deacetylase/succinyl-diaminopimelate desuccinylase-like protein